MAEVGLRQWIGSALAALATTLSLPLVAAEPPTTAEVEALLARRAYAEAQNAALQHLDAVEAASGRDSLAAADALDLLGRVLDRAERAATPELLDRLDRVVELRQALQGPESPALAASLALVARASTGANRLDLAEALYTRALAITRALHGDEDADTASLQVGLASVVYRRGDYARARELLEAALTVQERLLGPEHPDVAGTLNGLASSLDQLGDYTAARELWERALEIRRTALGPDDPAVAQSLNNLALARYREADFLGALASYREALDLRRRTLPANDPRIAYSLNGCALVLWNTGDLTAARNLLEEALTIFATSLGPDHPETVICLGQLAHLAVLTGDVDRALELAARMVAAAAAFGADHHRAGSALIYRAMALRAAGRLAEARTRAEEGFRVIRAALGDDHEELAWALLQLTEVDRATGRLDLARAHGEEALRIRERAFGPGHPKVADVLQTLAGIDLARGDLAAGTARAKRAIADHERAVGPDNPAVGEDLLLLARLHRAAGRNGPALTAAIRAEEIGRRHFLLVLQALSEREALRFADLRRSGLDLLLGLASDRDAPAPAVRAAWEAVLRSRALVVDEMAERRRVAAAGGADLEGPVAALAAARENYARLLIRGIGSDSRERFGTLLRQARARLDEAEHAVAQRSATFRADQRRQAAGLEDLVTALPPSTALVGFVRRTPPATDPRTPPADAYLALVLPADRSPQPRALPLGPADALDGMLAEWRRTITRAGDAPLDENATRRAGEALRRSLWDPVAAVLGTPSTVLVVPDGTIQLVNLAALPVGTDSYLVEHDPTLHVLTTERDLLAPTAVPVDGRGLLELGGPAYDELVAGSVLNAFPEPVRGPAALCESFRSLHFPPLPGSAAEVAEVAREWAAAHPTDLAAGALVQLTGAEATETAFKRAAPGRAVLHLATHGFFLGPGCSPLETGTRGVGALVPAAGPPPTAAADATTLHLSGLALAGANHSLDAPPGRDDGVLTAEEVVSHDLEGVDWAVLSDCDTGLGVVAAGEGVLGLRRAFRVAGVRTVVMSLWSVQDEAARAWMEALYRARLRDRLGAGLAVRQASRDVLEQRRSRGESTHPFYWGAFIAAGNWR